MKIALITIIVLALFACAWGDNIGYTFNEWIDTTAIGGGDFETWSSAGGADQSSIVADPEFIDWDSDNYTIDTNSVAANVGQYTLPPEIGSPQTGPHAGYYNPSGGESETGGNEINTSINCSFGWRDNNDQKIMGLAGRSVLAGFCRVDPVRVPW